MKSSHKRILILAFVAAGIAVAAVVLLYRPKRAIVIEVQGPTNRAFDAVLIVDGQRHNEEVTLPKAFSFYARKVSYRVTPLDTAVDIHLTGRMYTDDGFADGSCTGWSVGGHIECSTVLGIWFGGVWPTTYTIDSPGPDVTHL